MKEELRTNLVHLQIVVARNHNYPESTQGLVLSSRLVFTDDFWAKPLPAADSSHGKRSFRRCEVLVRRQARVVALITGFEFGEKSSIFAIESVRTGSLPFNLAQNPCRRAPSKCLILFTAK